MNRSLGLKTGTRALALGTLLACGAIVGCGGGNKNPMGGSGSASGMSGSVGSGSTSGTVASGSTSGGTGASGTASSGTVPMMQPCAAPTFTPPTGSTVMAGTNVVITAAAGSTIHFTTDGSTPTDASPTYNSGAIGVQVTGTTETFEAISTGTTCSDSAVATAMYTISTAMPDGGPGTAPPTPSFTPGGTMTTQNNDFTVTLASAGAANVCYTLGTTAPTCGAAGACGAGAMTFATATPISISAANVTAGQVEVQAIACAADGTPSAVGMQQYTLQVATPTITPAMGAQTYSATLMGAFATITTGTGVTIDYTTNGTAPSCATPVAGQMTYAAPFALTSGTYNAIACKMGYLASAVLGPLTYTVSLTPPTITPAAGALTGSATLTVSNAANPATSWVCYSTSATVPACGAAGVCSAGTLLPMANTITGLTDGESVQVIACAPAGLSNSMVGAQGPYKLQLAPPLILPDALTAPVASYTLTNADGADVNHLNIVQASVGTAADQAGGYLCWLKDPGVGIAPACGPNSTCLNGSNKVTPPTPDGPTDIEPNGPFGAGDSVAVVTCPGTTTATGLGFSGSTASTTVFVGQGQAMPPTISATDNSATQTVSDTANNWFSKVNAILTNPNAAAMTVCYTTDGTAPACTPGSVAAGCATVDGTSSENLNFKITAAGVGYVNPPTVTLAGGGGTCTGGVVAALTAGAVSSITATGCSGYTTPPSVTLNTGAGAAATGTASETVTFTVSNGGAGYTGHPPTVNLISADGVGSCVATPHLTGDAVTSITATGCTFDADPTVTFDNTAGGGGAVATAHVTQTVALTVTNGGLHYTANPVVTLKPTTGTGGTCTAVSAVETGGAVTAVTATGCSGFGDVPMAGDIKVTFASQGPVDGTANAAAAIAVPGNSISLAAIEKNPTVVRTLACNAGLGSSPIVQATYDTQLQDPTIVATDTLTGTVVTGVLTAGDTLTISTTSNFTDTTLVYTTDGSTPACAAGGTTKTFTGASTTIAVPAPQAGAFTVKVIACGANQLASAVQPATFTSVDVAAPVVTSKVGTTAVGSPGTDSTETISAQNVVTATITSPTAGSYICYSTTGAALTCAAAGAAAACPGNNTTLINALTGNVTLPALPTTSLTAIACVNGNASALTGPVVYNLAVTPAVVVGTPTTACPSVATVGFDYAATSNTNAGGPTTAANLCYSLSQGTPVNCATGGTWTCFAPTAAAPTTPVSLNETGSIYTVACKANFTPTPVTLGPYTVAAYTQPAITVDGVINTTEWSAALGDQFPTAAGGTTSGGFTFGTTTTAGDTLFFSQKGFTVGAGMSVYLYLTDTTTETNGTTSPQRAAAGSGNLPNAFQAQYAIQIAATAACGGANAACAITTYTNAGAGWTAQAMPFAVNAVVAGGGALEASVLITALPGAEAPGQAFDVAGEVYKSTAPAAVSEGWSKTAGGAETYLENYSAALCSMPIGSLN